MPITKRKDFEEMQVWQDAQELAAKIYQQLSKCKDYSFSDQIKRAAVSISNNIAEGSERKTNTDGARFLDISKGSCGEVRSMLHLAVNLGYMDKTKAKALRNMCLDISKQLAGFAKYLRQSEIKEKIRNS